MIDPHRLTRSLDLLASLWMERAGAVLEVLEDQAPGYPTGSRAGGRRTGNPQGDPTASAATGWDPAGRAMESVTRELGAAVEALARLNNLARTWAPTPPKYVTAKTANLTDGCEVLARIGHYDPVFVRTSLGGLLPRTYRLGGWAYRFARGHGRIPTKTECREHLNHHATKRRTNERRSG